MKTAILSALLGAAVLAPDVVAHPGHNHAREAAQRNAYLANASKRSLAHCASSLKARGNEAAMISRRHAKAEALRKKRSVESKSYLKARDLDSVLATSHNQTGVVDPTSDPSVLFAGNASCILTPETTQGPYWVSGELVREDITEDQEGVALSLDVQLIDVNTCNPVPDVYLEIWHCNSTGVYSGVVASGNGDSSDETNLDATFLRGIQKSDAQGVAAYETLFPGHYTGRATHIHVLAHLNATVLPNNTVTGGVISHVGQLFFDQDLISAVEAVAPYNTNTQDLTTNADDSILSGETDTDGVDPVVDYVLLGDDLSAGIFSYIAFGFDATANYTVSPAAYLTADGGETNPNSQGGGGAGGNGTVPSGAPPSKRRA